eukprot:UC1_evm1s1206
MADKIGRWKCLYKSFVASSSPTAVPQQVQIVAPENLPRCLAKQLLATSPPLPGQKSVGAVFFAAIMYDLLLPEVQREFVRTLTKDITDCIADISMATFAVAQEFPQITITGRSWKDGGISKTFIEERRAGIAVKRRPLGYLRAILNGNCHASFRYSGLGAKTNPLPVPTALGVRLMHAARSEVADHVKCHLKGIFMSAQVAVALVGHITRGGALVDDATAQIETDSKHRYDRHHHQSDNVNVAFRASLWIGATPVPESESITRATLSALQLHHCGISLANPDPSVLDAVGNSSPAIGGGAATAATIVSAATAAAKLPGLVTVSAPQDFLDHALVSKPMEQLQDVPDEHERESPPHPILHVMLFLDVGVARSSALPSNIYDLADSHARFSEDRVALRIGRELKRILGKGRKRRAATADDAVAGPDPSISQAIASLITRITPILHGAEADALAEALKRRLTPAAS